MVPVRFSPSWFTNVWSFSESVWHKWKSEREKLWSYYKVRNKCPTLCFIGGHCVFNFRQIIVSHTEDILACRPEIGLLVSKLFSFETFANSRVLVSVSENLVSEKKSRFRFRKIWSRKKSIGFGFGKNWSRKKVSVSVSENLVS